ncbi:MAG: hypothetical protein QM820_19875 [Minicystis sp.]
MREAEEDDIHPRGRFLRGELLEPEIGESFEVRVRGGERLADEIDGRDADQLDVGVDEEPADDLGSAVAAAADDGGLEALHGSRA